MAFGVNTYADAARREDLLDLLADINPDMKIALNGYSLGKSQTRRQQKKDAKLLGKWMTMNLKRY